MIDEVAMGAGDLKPRNPRLSSRQASQRHRVFDNKDSYAYNHCQGRWSSPSRIMHIVTLAVAILSTYGAAIQNLHFVSITDFSDAYARWAPVRSGRIAHFHFVFPLFVLFFKFLPHATRLKNVSFGFWRVLLRLENECFPSCESSAVFLTTLCEAEEIQTPRLGVAER